MTHDIARQRNSAQRSRPRAQVGKHSMKGYQDRNVAQPFTVSSFPHGASPQPVNSEPGHLIAERDSESNDHSTGFARQFP